VPFGTAQLKCRANWYVWSSPYRDWI
jgi:hypothetical protein